METIHAAVQTLSARKKGCSCLEAWKQFQASKIQAELQQGVFNDVNEIGTSKKKIKAVAPPGWKNTVKHMKRHKEITNPYALSWWMKDKGDSPHK